MIVLFKKLHSKKETYEDNDNIENQEETEEQLEIRLEKKIKAINRRFKIKQLFTIILTIIVLIGSLKSLMTINVKPTSALAVNDYAFVEEYLMNYFKFPKEATETMYLEQFSVGTWQVEYGFDRVQSANVQGIDIYFVKQNEDGSLSYYAKENLAIKIGRAHV